MHPVPEILNAVAPSWHPTHADLGGVGIDTIEPAPRSVWHAAHASSLPSLARVCVACENVARTDHGAATRCAVRVFASES